MVFSIGAILGSFILSLVLVAVILKICHKKNWYDKVDGRKIHSGNIPRLGGIGFAAAFILAAISITVVKHDFSGGGMIFFPLLGLITITCLGAADDFRALPPKIKLLGHCICALLVIVPGYAFTHFFFYRTGINWGLGWLSFPVSFLWIIGMTNAVNLIDGMDGLAGGVSLLISLFFASVLILLSENGHITLLYFCLAAVLLGFLIFNAPLPKARIFMGDGGAYFLGYVLAVLPLLVSRDTSGNTLPVFTVGALALIPVFDSIAAIWRRIRDRRRIDSPDKFHVHHKLINLGLNPLKVNLLLSVVQIFLGVMVILSTRASGALSLVFLGSAYLGGLIFFAVVHFLNRRFLKRQNHEPGRA